MRGFLVVVGVAFVCACSGKSASNDTRSCPPGAPKEGSACTVETLRCVYGTACGATVVCTSGAWAASSDGCGDAATPECPSTPPRAGEPCPGPTTCPYACGDAGTLTASCSAGSWKLVASGCALP